MHLLPICKLSANHSFMFHCSIFQDSRCRLLLRISHDVNGHHREEAFCEFKSSILKLSSDDEKTTQAKFLNMFKSGEIESGKSFLSTSKTVVSEDSNQLKITNTDLTGFISTDTAQLVSSNGGSEEIRVGTKTVMILRVITGGGTQTPPSSEVMLSDKWFGTSGDPINNKSQFAACSNGQLQFEPFIGTTSTGVEITNGVYTITVGADQQDPNNRGAS